MPFVRVTYTDRSDLSDAVSTELLEGLRDALVETLGVRPEQVRAVIDRVEEPRFLEAG